jgi:hypothetical protein
VHKGDIKQHSFNCIDMKNSYQSVLQKMSADHVRHYRWLV